MSAPWWVLPPLAHHDPNAAQGAEGFRAWLGQDIVHQVSVTLHATGALLVVGGLAAVLLMRSIGNEAWSPRGRFWVRNAVLGGWVLNFLGGAMRLYEPDHPGLTAIASSSWVQIIAFKHLALMGAVVFSLLALEMGPQPWTRRLRQHAAIALVLVLVASVSGGAATTRLGPAPMDDGALVEGGDEHAGHLVYRWQNATVDVSGATPLTPKNSELPLAIGTGTSEILVRLQWASDQSIITAELIDPSGEVAATSGRTTSTSAEVTADGNISAGTWNLRISSQRAVSESVTVAVRIAEGGTEIRVLEETIAITRYIEINMYMDPGEYFNYTWSLAAGDPAIPWDIHSHPSETEVETHHEGRDTSGEGTFVGGPNKIYSIYWRPDPGQLVTLTYRVEGNFTVHSIARG